MRTDTECPPPHATFQSNDEILDPFSVIPIDVTSVIRKHSRSFSTAARWLPADVRSDVEKLYAWCRWCDEAVDGASNQKQAIRRLAVLRDDVRRVFDGQAVRHPASQWLSDLVKTRGIREAEAFDLLAGMEMDLHLGQVDDEEALLRYCYCVAGVVGLMMCRVMGVNSRSAEKYAVDLGMAMQMTNIARDVAEDWMRGRSYLPKTWIPLELPMVCFETSPAADVLIKFPSNAAVRESVQRLLAMAEVRYASGLRGSEMLPRGCRPAIELAAKLYREIGREILRQEGRVMDGRTAVPRARIIWVGGSALLRSLFDYLAGVKHVVAKHSQTMSGRSAHQYSRPSIALRDLWFGISSIFTNDKGLQTMTGTKEQKMNDAKYLAYLGVSLTAFMASALFVMVSINPKDASYAALPILYAIISVGVGVATNFLARRAAMR